MEGEPPQHNQQRRKQQWLLPYDVNCDVWFDLSRAIVIYIFIFHIHNNIFFCTIEERANHLEVPRTTYISYPKLFFFSIRLFIFLLFLKS